ncbi:MAG: hypothetical protein R3F48_02645 [Candidatus Zixiibacteriota bacterium]
MISRPIRFEQQFLRLMTRLRNLTVADIRLTLLASFWPTIRPMLDNRTYDSHIEEYLGAFIDQCRGDNLDDLRIAELEDIHGILASLMPIGERLFCADEIRRAIEGIGIEWARKLCYIGRTESGVRLLERTLNQADEGNSGAISELPDGIDELDGLRLIDEMRSDRTDPASHYIRSILSDWELLREGVSHSDAACLFVEKHGDGTITRGRMRLLRAVAEYQQARATSHEVTFEHQIRSPDDPFVGSIYEALLAVRQVLSGPGFKRNRGEYIHSHFQIVHSDHQFTGDSIGLAAALVTFVQLLSTEVLRHERGIASCAVFTGSIDGDGKISAVNEDSLQFKVERAFCSPAKFMVLPRENLVTAHAYLEKLNREYPRRRLHLIAVERLDEVVADRNVLRSEKVCAGQYVIRKAGSYSRLGRIQIPLMIALLYILVCLVYPKVWIGFDWNPESLNLNETHDKALVYNENGSLLWQLPLDCGPVKDIAYDFFDLNGDGRKELMFLRTVDEAVPCSTSAQLKVYDPDGNFMWSRQCNLVALYPGDSAADQYYIGARLFTANTALGPIIVTDVAQSYPGRAHIKIWSADGELMGRYVHAGHPRAYFAWDSDGDGIEELFVIAINNPFEAMGVFSLPLKGCLGVSPPYEAPGLDLSWVKRGNQLHYVVLPTSDVTQADTIPYNTAVSFGIIGGGGFHVDIIESFSGSSWRSFCFDSTFRVTRVRLSDNFWTQRKKYVEGGFLPPLERHDYIQMVHESVLYWADSGWVSEKDLQAADNSIITSR